MTNHHIVMTNHVFSETMRKKEFAVNYRAYAGSKLRYRLLKKLVARQSREPRFDARDAIDIITEGPIAKMNNIQAWSSCPRETWSMSRFAPRRSQARRWKLRAAAAERRRKRGGVAAPGAPAKPAEHDGGDPGELAPAVRFAHRHRRRPLFGGGRSLVQRLDAAARGSVYPLLAGLMLFRSAPQQRDRDLKLEALHRARMLLDEAGARGPALITRLSSIFFAGGISISSAGARTGRGR